MRRGMDKLEHDGIETVAHDENHNTQSDRLRAGEEKGMNMEKRVRFEATLLLIWNWFQHARWNRG